MRLVVLLIFLKALPALASVNGGYMCARIFADAVVPRPLQFADPLYVSFLDGSLQAKLAQTESFLLGRGSYGDVHLIQDPATKTLSIEKRYEDNFWGRDQAKEDQALLRQFRATTAGKPVSFHFSDLQGTGHVLRGAFVRGRTLHDLLVRSELSVESRKALKDIYHGKLSALHKQLRQDPRYSNLDFTPHDAKFAFRDEKADGAQMLSGKVRIEGKEFQFVIKSDNIIVHPEDLHHMTVIDPL